MAAGQHPPMRVAALVVTALAIGVVTFAGVVVFLRISGEVESEVGRSLWIWIGAVALAEVPVYVAVRSRLLARVQGMREEAHRLLGEGLAPQPLFALTLVGAALAEGLGLLGAVAVLLGAPLAVLAVPAAAAALILAQLPSRERYEGALRGV
jgi:hypothetical protein